MNLTPSQMKSLVDRGYCILKFGHPEALADITSLLARRFPVPAAEYHRFDITQDEHVRFVKECKDEVNRSGLVDRLLAENAGSLVELMGPDVDVQQSPYVRISRPGHESDYIDWHRDTFYGCSGYELNFWFPVLPLEPKSGIALVPGSHLQGSCNIRDLKHTDTYRSQVSKGSEANQAGYLYAPKIDDSIANLRESDAELVSPQVGEGVLFFASMIHRAINRSQVTRVTVDTRVKAMHAPTYAKAGYYKPLVRGAMHFCAQRFNQACEEGVSRS